MVYCAGEVWHACVARMLRCCCIEFIRAKGARFPSQLLFDEGIPPTRVDGAAANLNIERFKLSDAAIVRPTHDCCRVDWIRSGRKPVAVRQPLALIDARLSKEGSTLRLESSGFKGSRRVAVA